jgi:hypothetical protein
MKNKSLLLIAAGFLATSTINAQVTAPVLGITAGYGLFTNAGEYTNAGFTVVNGDLGNNAGAYGGFPDGVVNGSVHLSDPYAASTAAQVTSVANQMALIDCDSSLAPAIGDSMVLKPYAYCIAGDAILSDTLILDGQGDPNSVFVFKLTLMFTTAPNSAIVLINGAQAKNVYWRIGGAMSLGTNSDFSGTIVITGATSFGPDANLTGRVLATAGAINLLSNNINSTGPGFALDVSLVKFSAVQQASAVTLAWQTASEHNSESFIVERSATAASGIWEPIGTLVGAGSSNAVLNYTLTDRRPLSGDSYYRLRSNDLDGTSAISAVVAVSRKAAAGTEISAYPNPVRDMLTIASVPAGSVIRLTDVTGRLLTSMPSGGTGLDQLSTANIPAGTYFLQAISADGATASQRIIRR